MAALLSGALLGPVGNGSPQHVAKRGLAKEERARQRPDLSVGSRARAGEQHRIRETVLGQQAVVSALGQYVLQATLAEVI